MMKQEKSKKDGFYKEKEKGLKKPKNLSVKQKKNSKKAEGTRNFRKSSTKKPVIKTKKAKTY